LAAQSVHTVALVPLMNFPGAHTSGVMHTLAPAALLAPASHAVQFFPAKFAVPWKKLGGHTAHTVPLALTTLPAGQSRGVHCAEPATLTNPSVQPWHVSTCALDRGCCVLGGHSVHTLLTTISPALHLISLQLVAPTDTGPKTPEVPVPKAMPLHSMHELTVALPNRYRPLPHGAHPLPSMPVVLDVPNPALHRQMLSEVAPREDLSLSQFAHVVRAGPWPNGKYVFTAQFAFRVVGVVDAPHAVRPGPPP
jgi:hypothetical protein